MASRNQDSSRLFAYHEATKHSYQSVHSSRWYLDWANQPDPFRHYDGTPVVDLPAGAPAPETPVLTVLAGVRPAEHHADGPAFLSRLLYYSASISASKRVPSTGGRYSLRVNPSSGNLHPTEFHFATRGLRGWEDGLYHYRPSQHTAEQRARGSEWTRALLPGTDARVVFLLTSIAWREAWKYRSRAYRYCLHDIGHAWESLALAARALGCGAAAHGDFVDNRCAEVCEFHDEWPMLLVELSGEGIPIEERPPAPSEWFGGAPNRLSPEPVEYPLIDAIHEATKLDEAEARSVTLSPASDVPPLESEPFGAVVRRRRSALDFDGGARTISREQYQALLDAAQCPFDADFGSPLVRLYAYVHRVDGLAPGVYLPDGTLIKSGDQRVMAAALSLGQNLGGNSCVTFSMIADLEGAARQWGNRGYRYAHFQAGAIGQRLYLASEGMGFQSTGMGAFYDDEVNTYLGLTPGQGQVIYHFGCGYAVYDERLEA